MDDYMDFLSAISAIFASFRRVVAMDTAVGKIAVHTVNLRQVLGTADRADIHVEFLVAAVIAVSQGQVDALVVAELHCTLDQRLDRAFVIADRIAHVLGFFRRCRAPRNVPRDPVSGSG